MAQGKAEKSVSIDELREAASSLKAWRTGALVRLARKQTERVIRRSGTRPLVEELISRNRHGKR